jgi:iron-sulfur cluster insertion protein
MHANGDCQATRSRISNTPTTPKGRNKMNLQPAAVDKLKELVAEEGNPDLMLRVFVQGGGCSGFSYGFTFDEVQNEDDFDFVYDSVKVVVDAMSMQYLQDSAIDYREDAMGASFVINNPQAVSTCGCGSSFSV